MLIEIGYVEAIFRYPVKSMAGERLEDANLTVRAGERGSHFRRLVPEPMIRQREPRLAGTR